MLFRVFPAGQHTLISFLGTSRLRSLEATIMFDLVNCILLADSPNLNAKASLTLETAPLGSLLHASRGVIEPFHFARSVRLHNRICPRRFADNLINLSYADSSTHRL